MSENLGNTHFIFSRSFLFTVVWMTIRSMVNRVKGMEANMYVYICGVIVGVFHVLNIFYSGKYEMLMTIY